MGHFVQSTEDRPSLLVRAAAFLAVPIVFLLALPLLLLAVLAFYLLAAFQGGRVIVVSFGKTQPAGHELPKPHFVEGTVKSVPDETTPST